MISDCTIDRYYSDCDPAYMPDDPEFECPDCEVPLEDAEYDMYECPECGCRYKYSQLMDWYIEKHDGI